MDLERDKRLNDILGRLFERPTKERHAFLEEACGDDDALLDEALEYLGHEGEIDDFLERPIMETRVTPPLPAPRAGAPARGKLHGLLEQVPERIGPFRVLEILGKGGMGIVYLAEQTEPVRRQVAIKLVHSSLESTEAHKRFAAERQAMAMLVHPNVARILEAGTTDDGFPYFAMEYVPGVPITEYCDREKLPVAERLELFTAVCRGVQHAHRNQIVHRDLKPSNILVALVDERPVPKIIDFGVAKALGHRLTEMTVATGRRMIGTPPYMSPEALQFNPSIETAIACGEARAGIDTRADVYSLGVLLYKLVAGVHPFDTRRMSFYQICRQVVDEDPPLPSERFYGLGAAARESIAAERRLEPAELVRLLGEGLDRIVARAIARDRHQRYGSAAELAADLERTGARDRLPAATRDLLEGSVRGVRDELGHAPALRAQLLATLGAVYLDHGHYREAEPLLAEAVGLPGEHRAASRMLVKLLRATGRHAEAAELEAREPSPNR